MDHGYQQQVTLYATIKTVRTNYRSAWVGCRRGASLKDEFSKAHGVCLDDIRHNLVVGNVAYIDDGEAQLKVRHGWLGTVVDEITWLRRYTSRDRVWSVEEQKYIYFNY